MGSIQRTKTIIVEIMKAIKVVWEDKGNVFVVWKGDTSNKKITDGKPLVQTYTFSMEQWTLATNHKGFGMKTFFSLDASNCLDCPFSGNQGEGGCYTHKFNQYVGFISMLRSIKPFHLTPLDYEKRMEIIDMCYGTYVRFGTYGEPSLLPLSLVEEMASYSDSYTGYTHQWKKDWAEGYGDYFMASTHSQFQSDVAKKLNYRSFIATKDGTEDAVVCPASNEAGFKSNCATCGLCSGLKGKGSKDVKIMEH
jgi:hypothetical protein